MTSMTTTVTQTLAVSAQGLVKEFRPRGAPPVRAVDGVSLTIPAGQIVAFLGPNGAGKTTTLDMLLGLTVPDAGTVAVAGLPPRTAVRAGKVSAVLQSGGLLADLTVGETVRLIASTFDNPRPAGEVLERAGITALSTRRVSKCSGGEQQRLRFALALLPDPEVLILDEPTAGMDVGARHEFWDTMKTDTAAGRTVVFATHYLEEADAFAERIVMVASGKIVADGTTNDIRAQGAGRTVSVEIPEQDADHWIDRVRTLPGVTAFEIRGHRVQFSASDTDATALTLLRDLGARGLEIASPTLDSAFLTLTGKRLPDTSPPDKSGKTHNKSHSGATDVDPSAMTA
ncbi:MAG: ABC transporter ATP-binding protein [Nakamurella sp.]